MKMCTKCKKEKQDSDFGMSADKRVKRPSLKSWCRPCNSEYQRGIYANNPEKQRLRQANYALRYKGKYNIARRANRLEIYISECSRKYGASKSEIRDLLNKKACEICGGTYRLSVDHCHTKNKIRGLLCDGCNNMLGRAKDSIKTLQNAIKYLNKCITS